MDKDNLDSIASWIYYDIFTDFIRSQHYFYSITVLEPSDFGKVTVSDSLVMNRLKQDTTGSVRTELINPGVLKITHLVNSFKSTGSKKDTTLFVDPEFGFYTRNKLEKIAYQTNADVFLSFNFFAAIDGIYSPDYYLNLPNSLQKSYLIEINKQTAEELVYIFTNWNFYD